MYFGLSVRRCVHEYGENTRDRDTLCKTIPPYTCAHTNITGEKSTLNIRHIHGKRGHVDDFDVEIEIHFDNTVASVDTDEFACEDMTRSDVRRQSPRT